MKKNDLFPISTTKINGIIDEIGGVSLKSLTESFGTPLYLYDAATLFDLFDQLEEALKVRYASEYQIAYASKAYLSLKFARKIAQLGCAIDVVSLGEMKMALEAVFPSSKIHLHGNNKSEKEIRLAVEMGIGAIIVDSLSELNLVESICKEIGENQNIWLRINPDVAVKTHKAIQTGNKSSKFGISIANGEAAKVISAALNSQYVTLNGIHTHLGSQIFEDEPYSNALVILMNVCKKTGWHPQVISPGGGWGVPYNESTIWVKPDNWIAAAASTLKEWCEHEKYDLPKLVVEPGRWLIARAGVAVYRVGSVKDNPDGGVIAAVDGGMADNPRPAMYGANYSAELLGTVSNRPRVNVRLVGKFCESGDELIHKIELPKPQRGDLVAVPVSGAYQLSMASNYNLADRPAVVWVEGGRVEVLQKREIACDSAWWRGE